MSQFFLCSFFSVFLFPVLRCWSVFVFSLFSLGFFKILFSSLARLLSAVFSLLSFQSFLQSSRFEITHVAWTGLRHQIGICNILICLQKHSQHNKDERTQFFRKIYLSLYSKGLRKGYQSIIEWEVSRRLNKDCNILNPPPHTHKLLAIAAFHSRSSGLLNIYNNLTSTCFLWASHFALSSTRRQSRLSPNIPDRMHLLFTQVHFSSDSLAR